MLAFRAPKRRVARPLILRFRSWLELRRSDREAVQGQLRPVAVTGASSPVRPPYLPRRRVAVIFEFHVVRRWTTYQMFSPGSISPSLGSVTPASEGQLGVKLSASEVKYLYIERFLFCMRSTRLLGYFKG
ncbi:hypothetical protein MPL3356_460008 [Mesorhizobium plurifarium]|uniref:Uncharacterized protein n=1 Tax=Mesorhizobium plurifarium TaxID=69974 RepID=A0A090EBC6_MESPL|nr:hypothetical protein MPL3356_460008 [Mesorhizobium plurifarium]